MLNAAGGEPEESAEINQDSIDSMLNAADDEKNSEAIEQENMEEVISEINADLPSEEQQESDFNQDNIDAMLTSDNSTEEVLELDDPEEEMSAMEMDQSNIDNILAQLDGGAKNVKEEEPVEVEEEIQQVEEVQSPVVVMEKEEPVKELAEEVPSLNENVMGQTKQNVKQDAALPKASGDVSLGEDPIDYNEFIITTGEIESENTSDMAYLVRQAVSAFGRDVIENIAKEVVPKLARSLSDSENRNNI